LCNVALQETFEDAVDTGSLRSLTKHQQPVKRAPVEDRTDSDYEDEASQPAAANSRPDSQEVPAEKKIPRPLSQASAGSLEPVNLDDDAATTTAPAQQGMFRPPDCL
jgi:hypothetical protein